jgi:hypothetical protein
MKREPIAFVAAMCLVMAVPMAALAAPKPKVTICHIPPGNPGNAHTITVGAKAADSHIANHGDTLGACGVEANQPPEADAGDDVCVLFGDDIVLDGSDSSDPEGDPLTYEWVVSEGPDGSSATLGSSTEPTTSFNPDRLGDYVIELTVDDGEDSDRDEVRVGVTMEVTLDSDVYVVAVGEPLAGAVTIAEPAPAGGAEVHITLTPAAVDEGKEPGAAYIALTEDGEPVDSIVIAEGADSAGFFIVAKAEGAVALTALIGSDFCNRGDSAEVVIADSLVEAIKVHIDEDLERLAADLERLLNFGLSQDPEFESSSLWTALGEALVSLGILIDEIIDVLANR